MALSSLFDVGETVSHAVGLLEDLVDLSRDIKENTEERPHREVHTRRSNAGTVGASGILDIPVGPPPPGWAWRLERLATTAGAGGSLAVYLNSVEPMNLIEVVAAPQEYADEFANGLYVPSSETLIFRFRTQPVGSICTVAIQAKQFSQEYVPQPATLQ